MLESLYNSTIETITDLNPVADNIRKKDRHIIDILMENGVKDKDIFAFIDVYKSDVKEYVQLQKASIKQAKKMIRAKAIIKEAASVA
jgi:hypothetical protein